MNHYYQNNTNLKSDVKTIDYTFHSKKLVFKVDNGVFSKERVDFGTNVLLNSIDVNDKVSSIIDVGCGYGVIGLCLASYFPQAKITMVDVNDRALDLVVQNASLNKIRNIKVVSSNVYDQVDDTFDVIISNPPIRAGKSVVHKIVEDGHNKLNANGSIWIVIQKKQGAPSMEKKMYEVFGNVETVKKENGYYIFKSIKNA